MSTSYNTSINLMPCIMSKKSVLYPIPKELQATKDFNNLQKQIVKEGEIFHIAYLVEEVESLTKRVDVLEQFILEKLNFTLEDLINFEQSK